MSTSEKLYLRTVTILAAPFVLALAFVSQLIKGLRSAFYYAWMEVLIEAESFRKFWALCDGSRSFEQIRKLL